MKYLVYAVEAWPACYENDDGDSWDINHWHNAGIMEIPSSVEGNAIIELMIEEGYLKPRAQGLVYAEDISDSTIRICSDSSFEPLFDLVMIEGGE
jgi:hypothetical protein